MRNEFTLMNAEQSVMLDGKSSVLMDELEFADGCRIPYCTKCGALVFDSDQFSEHEDKCDGTAPSDSHVILPAEQAARILGKSFTVVDGMLMRVEDASKVLEETVETEVDETGCGETRVEMTEELRNVVESAARNENVTETHRDASLDPKEVEIKKFPTQSLTRTKAKSKRKLKKLPHSYRKSAKTLYVEVLPVESDVTEDVGVESAELPVEVAETMEEVKGSDCIQNVDFETAQNAAETTGSVVNVANTAIVAVQGEGMNFECLQGQGQGQILQNRLVSADEIGTVKEVVISCMTVEEEVHKKKRCYVPRNEQPKSLDYSFSVKNGEEIISCRYCTYTTKNLRMLARHLSTHNENGQPFVCEVCSFQCMFRGLFQAHVKKHSREWECKECSYKCSNERDLKRHMLRHEGVMPHVCDFCGKEFRQKTSLEIHKRVHSGDLFKCAVDGCDYSTPNAQTLKSHQQRKHELNIGLAKYVCDCGYGTSHRTEFVFHRKSHLGLKDHKCPYCDYMAVKKCEVKKHMKKHSRTKIYQCNQCEFETSHETSLRHHLMAHEKMKPYSCSLCNYKNISKTKIQYHMESQHPGQPMTILFDGYHLKVDLNSFKNPNSTVRPDEVLKLSYVTREREAVTLVDDRVESVSVIKEVVVNDFEREPTVGTFQCGECRFRCFSASALASHVIEAHEDSVEEDVIVDEDLVGALSCVQAEMDVQTS